LIKNKLIVFNGTNLNKKRDLEKHRKVSFLRIHLAGIEPAARGLGNYNASLQLTLLKYNYIKINLDFKAFELHKKPLYYSFV